MRQHEFFRRAKVTEIHLHLSNSQSLVETEFHTVTMETVSSMSSDFASSSINNSNNGREDFLSSPEPSRSPSPGKARSQSPGPRLLTSRRWYAGSIGRLCRSNPVTRQSLSPSESCSTGPCLRLTKDPVQPSTGSLSDIRGHQNDQPRTEEDEDFDDFPDVSRPRAFTCPVTKAFNRKLRSKILNRPPTPTYKTVAPYEASIFDFQILELSEKATDSASERRMSEGHSELEAIMETL